MHEALKIIDPLTKTLLSFSKVANAVGAHIAYDSALSAFTAAGQIPPVFLDRDLKAVTN